MAFILPRVFPGFHFKSVCLVIKRQPAAGYWKNAPRKYGQTMIPKSIFHHTRWAKPIVNSQPANQKEPANPAPPLK